MVTHFLLVNLYAALFFGLYLLFLKNRDAYQWSRFYLLISSALALMLPLVKFNLFSLIPLSSERIYGNRIPELILHVGTGTTKVASVNSFTEAYIVICVLLFFRLLIPFIRLSRRVKKLRRNQGYARILVYTGMGPGSFGKTILFPSKVTEPAILAHEEAHIRNMHYLDKMYVHLLLCFCFPVIVFYAMRKELDIIQEFQADAVAAEADPESYSRVLLQQCFPAGGSSLIHSFFKHPIKRRIMMLFKTPKPVKKALLLLAAILSVSGLLLLQNADPVSARQKTMPENVFRAVDQMPEFPGGDQALLSYFSSHITYPESAVRDSIQGKMFVEFVVGADGKVRDVTILKGLTADCDAEIIRVIKNMPDWKPGEQDGKKVAVYYTIPVTFSFNRASQGMQDFKYLPQEH